MIYSKDYYEEQFLEYPVKDIFKTVGEQNYKGPWLKYIGGEPYVIDDKTATNGKCLRLECKLVNDKPQTAAIWTRNNVEFPDGTIEVRARFKGACSSWPAIWMTSKNEDKTKQYEIDLCEYFGKRRWWCKTGIFMPKHLKWGLQRLFRPKKHPRIKMHDWNIFKCSWDEKEIKIYVNGKKVLTYKNKGNEDQYPQTFTSRCFCLILSMQYGHGYERWKQLPAWMDIDYVKYISK